MGYREMRILYGWWLFGIIAAAAPPLASAEPETPSVLVVPECRLKFIEESILAGERNGIISEINAREGDMVRAGQRLAQLKDDIPRAQLATLIRQSESPESRAKIESAQLAEEFAIARYEIAVAAQKRNPDAVSRAEMLELRVAAERAGTDILKEALELELAKLKKREVEAELKSYSVVAPFNGVVTRVLKHRGESLQLGDAVIELVDPTRLKVEGYLPVQEARTLQPGTLVTIFEEGRPDSKAGGVEGKLVFIDVGVEPVSQKVRLWAEVDNSKRLLRPGLLARMEISPVKPPEQEPAR